MSDPKLVFMSMDDFVRLTDEAGPLPTAAPDMTSPDKPHPKRILPPQDLFALAEAISRVREPVDDSLDVGQAFQPDVATGDQAGKPDLHQPKPLSQGVTAMTERTNPTFSNPQNVAPDSGKHGCGKPDSGWPGTSLRVPGDCTKSRGLEDSSPATPEATPMPKAAPDVAPQQHGDPCGPKETYNPGLNPNHPQELSDKRIIRPKRPLPERVINDSEFQYYERQIGDSKLNFDNYQDFLRVSEQPPVRPWETGDGGQGLRVGENVAPDSASPSSSPQSPTPKKPRCTKAEKLQRLREIHQLMVENVPKSYIFQYAKEKWGIGRRSVQLYMKKIEERNGRAGESRDFVAHLEMTRQQCDHMYGLTYQMLARCKDPKEFASLMRVCQSWMKIREKAVSDMQEHRSLSSRDRSPSCENKQAERRRLIQMPIDEWFERITNLRNHWRWEWEQQLDMPAFVRQMKEEGNWTPDQKAYFEREHGYHDVICDCCGKTKV